MVFDFSEPVTWGDIISAISTVAAFAAVVVAMFANRSSSKSLEYSLRMQEQSKNVDLFEKRVSILEEVKASDRTAELPLQLLFDETISQSYQTFQMNIAEQTASEHDMTEYANLLMQMDGEGGYTSPIAQLVDAERQLDMCGYTEESAQDYDALCDKYQITCANVNDEENCGKIYNYKDLSERIAQSNQKVQMSKELLLQQMQNFIQKSISPIAGKGGKKL